MRTVRIGAGQGFYGDTHSAALDMIRLGDVSYVCFDALAELTLAILQKDRRSDPSLGYTRDLPAQIRLLLRDAVERGVRLITNAGGLNPTGAAEAVRAVARELGLDVKVATVTGDDLTDRLSDLRARGVDLRHLNTGASLDDVADRIVFACAYLGAAPIVDALGQGADVVVTGRVADPALFLAPLVHELGWSWDDWDRLAAGTIVGHLLECSGQVTGGNFSGAWRDVPEPWRLGYPLAEVTSEGGIVVGKPQGTGGVVSSETVSEQLLYEIQDPGAYATPDVVVDLTDASLEDLGGDRVRVRGVRGRARPATLKALIGYHDGWMGEGRVGYSYPDAVAKARRAEEIMRHRAGALEVRAEYQGWSSLMGPLADARQPEEVYLRLAVRARTRGEAEGFARDIPFLGLNGPPGVSGFSGITPPRELLGIWPTTVPREAVAAEVRA